MALDNKAFLSKISPPGDQQAAPSQTDDAVKPGELNVNDEKSTAATNPEPDRAVASAVQSPAASNVASKATESDLLRTDEGSEWVHKSKHPQLAAIQAEASPTLSGVMAPPPTPEAFPNLAVGQLFMNVLDEIPPDRILSLGDSIHAPRNYSKLRNFRSTAPSQSQPQPHFFSPLPQSSKTRDDPSFTRMSFQAAESPSAPIFNLSNASDKPPANFQLAVRGPPPAAELKKNAHLGKSNDVPSPSAALDRSNIYTSDTPDTPLAAASTNAINDYTPDTPVTPPAAPRLKPTPAESVTVPKINTPDVPDRPLDADTKAFKHGEIPLQPRYSRMNPFSTDNTTQPQKEDMEENEPMLSIFIPKPATGPPASDSVIDTPARAHTPAGGLLTPASVTFGAVSPESAKAAGIKTASMPDQVVGEDLEGALFFKAWPKLEDRTTRTAARVRKILLTGIPTDATPTLVASFVFGGPLEQIQVNHSSAFVTFLRGEDAAKYYEATGNGLLYEKGEVKHVIMTEMAKEVNPVSGILREYIEKEFTRCVRAIGVDEEWTMMALQEIAARKGRKVEKIVDGLNTSKASALRSVNFRFCDIADAVKFKQMLSRSEDWEECNIHFAPDPCDTATGIHFD